MCVAAQIQFREIAAAELVSDGRFAHRLRHIEIVAVYSPVSREWTEFPIRYRSYTLTMWRLRVKTI